MGKLTIEGRASKKYDYDQMSVSVTFHSRMASPPAPQPKQ